MPPKLPHSLPRLTLPSLSRHLTTATDTSPSAAIAAAAHLLKILPPTFPVLTETLTPHPLQKLSLLLARPTLHPDLPTIPPPAGTPLPPGYHLIYFTPAHLEANLGEDGTDVAFNAPAPFTRRMWAGGRMEWVSRGEDGKGLRVGEEVEEGTRVLGAVGKKGGDGRGMVVVEVEKVLKGRVGGGVVRDVRSWIFRPPFDPSTSTQPINPHSTITTTPAPAHTKSRIWDIPNPNNPSSFPERHMHWSPVALFGFSALTYNAHMIHYNESWTRTVEGHPGIVVHGPLNLINMLDYWRDVHGRDGLHLKSVTYRAMAPIYAGEEYRITSSVVEGGEEPRYEVLVKKGEVVCMRGEIAAEKGELRRTRG